MGDFYIVTWNKSDYVARVDQLSGHDVLLNMMEEDTRGLYFWPVRPDTSFEEIRVLKQRVDLEFILDQSTQRRQCYRIVFQFHFDHVRGDRGVWVGGLSMVLLFCLMF